MRTAAAALVAAAAVLAAPAVASATTFYVSAGGSDSNSGTSVGAAWHSVTKVNNASLAPGDSVLFEGGSSFGDAVLMPSRSGTAAAPIVFGSYGTGKAQLPQGVWLMNDSWLRIENLSISGPSTGIGSSVSGTGVTDLTIANDDVSNVAIGINSPNHADARWTITGNKISNTGDSGLILQGASFSVSGNTITNTGTNSAITYGKHGIYAKGPDMRIVGNTISGFQANGVSTRYENAVVEGNTISGGPIAIGYFQDDTVGGTTTIAYNRISGVTTAGLYLDGSAVESFVIADNSIDMSVGRAMDLRKVANLTLANNLVTGSFAGFALYGMPPAGSYSEHNDLWYTTSGPTWFAWNGTTSLDLAAYSSLSGQGHADRVADPALGPNLVPQPGSPAIDGGSANVGALAYKASCDGALLDYCGSAPDVGAVETLASAPAPAAALSPPSALSASSVTASSVTLAWAPSPDSRATGYAVGVDGATTGTTASTSYTLTGLACGTTHTLDVSAISASTAPSPAVTLTVTTSACPPVDLTPPTVDIVVPSNGSSVPLSFLATAFATDTGGVASVVLLVDGKAACTLTAPPYSCTLTVKRGWHTLTARATDVAGNVATASIRVDASSKLRTLQAAGGRARHHARTRPKNPWWWPTATLRVPPHRLAWSPAPR